MTITLIALMLLVWVALGVYGDDMPRGCLTLVTVPAIAVLMWAVVLLVWVGTLGGKAIHFEIEEVQ